MIPASTVQMLSGTSIIYSALLTIFYLKKQLYRHHFLGIFLILGGVLLVGYACFLYHTHGDEPGQSAEDMFFGIILLQIGIIFGACGFIVEEKFMRNHQNLDPILIVGCEGLSGSLMWIIILMIFQFIPCSSPNFCNGGRLENSYAAFEDYAANWILIVQSLAIAFIIPMSSISGVSTTKKGSAS